MREVLYNAVFKRKSIRKYDMAPLSQERLASVMKFANQAKPLVGGLKYGFSFLGTEEVKNLLPIKAPHYLCLFADKADGYLMNAGYVLQQVDLFLSAEGIGSCWLGLAKPGKNIPAQKDGMGFIIMLAFGKAAEPVHRENVSEFRRKKLSEITSIEGADELLEAVRLAPSASNTQAWFFGGSPKEIIVSRVRLNPIRAAIYGKMNQIDIGIALCHLDLSLEHQGKTAVFDFRHSEAPAGFEFMARVLA